MSKLLRPISIVFATLLFLGCAKGQEMSVTITIKGGAMANIAGKFGEKYKRETPSRILLINEYAGITGLSQRVKAIAQPDGDYLWRVDGNRLEEFYAFKSPILDWEYDIDLYTRTGTAAPAHISWIGRNVGLLMLDDLLPQEGPVGAHVTLDTPQGWKTYSVATTADGKSFDVPNVEKASFVIGTDLRHTDLGETALVLNAEWQFTDEEAETSIREVFGRYKNLFGSSTGRSQITILKFPSDVPPGQWEADTRGSSITILSSDAPFKSQSLNRLHEQLRHEMFHLWFPNGVNLSGNYDWFYEGFALYQSLKLGVAVNRIRFDDYLDTLSRAYAMDSFGSKRVSLIESSKSRFAGNNNTAVYARGMLVAFLCDLAMMDASKGKRSTDDLVREIYQKHPLSSPRVEGNDAVLSIMKQRPELVAIADKYVTRADTLDWAALLNAAGLEFIQNGREKALKVVAKPSGRQKDLLDKLGYNNWRKSGSK